MGMSLWAGDRFAEIGETRLWDGFFDTVAAALEDGILGSRFPLLHAHLRPGLVSPAHVAAVADELETVARELRALPPEGSPLPVHPDAEHLADTFVTSDGKLLVEVLQSTLAHAVKRGVAAHLAHVENPFGRDPSDARGGADLVAVFTAEKRYDDPGRTDRFWRDFDIEFDFLSKHVRYQWLEAPDGVAFGVRLGLPTRCRKSKKARGELRQAL